MCGGAQPVYDGTAEDYAFDSIWLAKLRDDGDGQPEYFLRWYDDRETLVPAGCLRVFLIRQEIFE